jgi:hypothetical protein
MNFTFIKAVIVATGVAVVTQAAALLAVFLTNP